MATKRTSTRVEKADRKASHRLNRKRDTSAVRAIGFVSDIGDQAPMRWLCASIILLGVVRHDPKLATTGLKMLTAHTLATWAKDGVKAVVDRTRPDSESGGYKFGLGDSDAHDQNSFPSGHSAGVVAVAQAFAREYPDHGLAARAAAGVIAVAQVPRGTHFIGDVVAGAVIGLVTEQVGSQLAAPAGSTPPSERRTV